jgi:hypothetical protein
VGSWERCRASRTSSEARWSGQRSALMIQSAPITSRMTAAATAPLMARIARDELRDAKLVPRSQSARADHGSSPPWLPPLSAQKRTNGLTDAAAEASRLIAHVAR